MEHTLPYLKASGGEVTFFGAGGHFLIGPTNERWDAVMLVRQKSVGDFLAFAHNAVYTWHGSLHSSVRRLAPASSC